MSIDRKCSDLGCRTPSGSECHCSRCHETFSNLSLFDEHYSKGHIVPDGLVRDDNGVWWTPEGLVLKIRKAAEFTARNYARARQSSTVPGSREARTE